MRRTITKRAEDRPEGQGDQPLADSGERGGAGRSSGYLAVLGLSLIALIVLAAVHLFPYVTRNYRYPTGWDAPTAVLRAKAVAASGIQRFGAIRSGVPLLLAVLMGSTGRNAYTLVAVVPALLMWVTALGAFALVRTTYDVRPVWLPVIAFVTWAAFGENGMLNLHLDNLMNASLVLPAFAAAAAFIRWRRGVLAMGILLAAAAVAHWPFYAFALGILFTTLALFVFAASREGRESLRASVRTTLPLAGAAAGSTAVAALTFLSRGQSGWIGARLSELRVQLKLRFLGNLHQVKTYYPLPLGILGAVTVLPRAPADRIPRRFFVCLLCGWTLVTIVGGLAQAAGLPTAGARELHYFFPASILGGLFVWWLCRRLASNRTGLGLAAAALVVIVVIGGLATLAVGMRSDDKPWFDRVAVQQTADASAYVAGAGGDEPVVVIFEPRANVERPSWLVVRSTLPQEQLPRTYPYYGTIQDYLVGNRKRPNGHPQPIPPAGFGDGGANPIVLVIQKYAPVGFREATAAEPDRVVAPGVTTLLGPVIAQPLASVEAPIGDTGGRHLAVYGLGIALILALAGGGWAWLLLPPDRVVRVSLAPALGTAAVTLTALAWAWARLPLRGAWGAGPLLVAAVLGWSLAVAYPRFRASRGTRS